MLPFDHHERLIFQDLRRVFPLLNDDCINQILAHLDPVSKVVLMTARRALPGFRHVYLLRFVQGSRVEYGLRGCSGFGSREYMEHVIVHRGILFCWSDRGRFTIGSDWEQLAKVYRMLRAKGMWQDHHSSWSMDQLRARLIEAL